MPNGRKILIVTTTKNYYRGSIVNKLNLIECDVIYEGYLYRKDD